MALSEYVEKICKIGQGEACCRYLVVGSKGFECMKVDPDNKIAIDMHWATHAHTSQGNNCEGKDPIPDQITVK